MFEVGDFIIRSKAGLFNNKNNKDQRYYLSTITKIDIHDEKYITFIISKNRKGFFYFDSEENFEKL